jgi:hypothetical protein
MLPAPVHLATGVLDGEVVGPTVVTEVKIGDIEVDVVVVGGFVVERVGFELVGFGLVGFGLVEVTWTVTSTVEVTVAPAMVVVVLTV